MSGLLSVCFYTYPLGLIVYGALRLFSGETLDIIRVLDMLMPPLILPALVLLPLSLLLHRWRIALLLLPTVIGFLLLYGGLFLPRETVQSQPDLTVMTYNIRSGNHNIDAISQVIRNSDADVVVLQEVSQNLFQKLPPDLVHDYAYWSLEPYPEPNTRLGLGVYSRYPLLNESFDVYQTQSSKLRFQIDVNGTRVTIYDVHLANPLVAGENFDPKAHGEGISALLDLLASETGPLIVAGDFNMTDASTDYGRMTTNLLDSFRDSGFGFGLTFPAWSPLLAVRLDYVFHSGNIRSLSAQVMPASGQSDHFPVRAALSLENFSVTPTPQT